MTSAPLAFGASLAVAALALVAGLHLVARQAGVARRLALVRRATGEPHLPFAPQRTSAGPGTGLEAARPPRWLALLAPDAAATARLRSLLASPAKAGLHALVIVAMVALMLSAAGLGALPLLVVTPAASLVAVRLLLRRVSIRERDRFKAQLPDAISLMVRGIRAGVPVAEAVAEVGREFSAPIGPAFRGAHEQVRLGQPLEAALWAVAARVGLPEMNFLCVTIAVQRETGGNLGETLSQLEQMIRKRAALQLKVRALSSEARASSLIIGALPLIMAAALFVMAPDYVAPLVETAPGRLLLATAVACLAIGGFVMAHIVRSQA